MLNNIVEYLLRHIDGLYGAFERTHLHGRMEAFNSDPDASRLELDSSKPFATTTNH